MKLHIEGREISEVMALKIRGLQIQSTRLNYNFVQRVEQHVNEIRLKIVPDKH